MQTFLRNQLERYARRMEELDFLLSREDIMADMGQYRTLSREHAEVTQIAGRFARYRQCEADLASARGLLDDPDMAELAQDEIAAAEAEMPALEAELQRLLLPKDPQDARNAFLEIRAGAGGDESALFAHSQRLQLPRCLTQCRYGSFPLCGDQSLRLCWPESRADQRFQYSAHRA